MNTKKSPAQALEFTSQRGLAATCRRFWNNLVARLLRQPLCVPALFSTLLGLGLAYFCYAWLSAPNLAANNATRNTIKQQETENEAARQIEQSEAAFRAEFQRVIRLYADSQPLLPSEVEITNVLAQVQESAVHNGVTLTGLNGSKEGVKSPPSDKLYERELPALVTGTHPQVVRFFYDVSRLPRIIVIRDFAVTSLRQRVSVGFTLVAYNSPPPSEMPPLPEEFTRLIGDAQKAQPR